jgi:nickel-type superoxide dismutase maturation protease
MARRTGRAGPARGLRRALLFYVVVTAVNRSLVEVAGWSMAPSLAPGERLVTVPLPRSVRAAGIVRRLVRPGALVVVAEPIARTGEHLVVKRVAAIDDTGVVVRGDHPSRSTDSRHYGPVALTSVRRVVVTRWPAVWRRP